MAERNSLSGVIKVLDLLLKGQNEIKSRLETIEADQRQVLEHVDKLEDVCVIQEEMQAELDGLSKTVERTHRKIRHVTRHLESNNIRGSSRSSSFLNLTDTRRRPSFDSDDSDDTVQEEPSRRNKQRYSKRPTGSSRDQPLPEMEMNFENNLKLVGPGLVSPPSLPQSPNVQHQNGPSTQSMNLQHQTGPSNTDDVAHQDRRPDPYKSRQGGSSTNHDQPPIVTSTPSKPQKTEDNGDEHRLNIPLQPHTTEPVVSEHPSTDTKTARLEVQNDAKAETEEDGATSAKGVKVNFDNPQSYLASLGITVTDQNVQRAIQGVFTDKGPDQTLNKIDGLRTVVLLDASSSVNEQMMNDMKHFFREFIDEVEGSASDHGLEETVAVAQFGGKCSIVQEFTNDYAPVRESVDTMVRGGKSPLLIGLVMVTVYLHKYGKSVTVEGRVVHPRIVLVSDGLLTNHENVGTEQDFEANTIRCQSKVWEFLDVINQLGYTVSCVGVGEYNKEFLTKISRQCKGRCFDGNGDNKESALLLGRYYRYQKPMTRICNEMSRLGDAGDIVTVVNKVARGGELTDVDREEMIKLCNTQFNIKRKSVENNHRETPPPDARNISPPESPQNIQMPSVAEPEEWESDDEVLTGVDPTPCGRTMTFGTRVKRGENWPRAWDSHDNGAMGTVVAHSGEGKVVVKWDNKRIHTYDQTHLSRVSDHRTLNSSETVEVGCKVKRGVDWDRGDEDGGQDTVGLVLRRHRNKTVTVMWPIGIMETYRFGKDGKYDLKVVTEAEPVPLASPDFPIHTIHGEVVAWQWQDEQNQWRTLSEEESAKIQSHVDGNVPGTIIVQHGGIQLRCDASRQKYQEIEGRRRAGVLRRYVGSADDIASLRFIEQHM